MAPALKERVTASAIALILSLFMLFLDVDPDAAARHAAFFAETAQRYCCAHFLQYEIALPLAPMYPA